MKYFSQYDQPWFYFELIGFVIVGILGGLYGALFNKLNLLYCNFRSWFPIQNNKHVVKSPYIHFRMFNIILNQEQTK